MGGDGSEFQTPRVLGNCCQRCIEATRRHTIFELYKADMRPANSTTEQAGLWAAHEDIVLQLNDFHFFSEGAFVTALSITLQLKRRTCAGLHLKIFPPRVTSRRPAVSRLPHRAVHPSARPIATLISLCRNSVAISCSISLQLQWATHPSVSTWVSRRAARPVALYRSRNCVGDRRRWRAVLVPV